MKNYENLKRITKSIVLGLFYSPREILNPTNVNTYLNIEGKNAATEFSKYTNYFSVDIYYFSLHFFPSS